MLISGLTLLFQLGSPALTYALTGGPQQPEFQGFTQIDTGNLVDPFTGDFKYQIPLMTIPGPNGGYPLNLTYAAGPSLEEEASWVGLGWSLNVGAVNRQMRGIPDDFKADVITKTQYTKPNTTVGFGIGVVLSPPEIYGADLGVTFSFGLNSQFYYNNYTGFGYRNSISPSFGLTSGDAESNSGISSGLSLNFDSNEGADVQPSFGIKAKDGKTSAGMDFGFGYSGRQGYQGMYMSSSFSRHSASQKDAAGNSLSLKDAKKDHTSSRGSSFNFSIASAVPRTTMSTNGQSFSFSIKPDAGAADNQFKIPITFSGRFSQQKVANEVSPMIAYGLHYQGYAMANYNSLMDYNIEKDASINVKIPNLPIPISTHDVYNVQASQLSLSFRNYRNDMGLFYEPSQMSISNGMDVGVEAGGGTGFKVGVNPRISFGFSYSGPWQGNAAEAIDKYKFRNENLDNGLLTNGDGVMDNSFSYFKVSGEPTADVAGLGFRMAKAGGTFGPVKFPINTTDASNEDFSDEDLGEYNGPGLFDGVQQFTTGITPQLGNQALGSNFNSQKVRKNTLIEYRTQEEVINGTDGILRGYYVSNNPITTSTGTPTFTVNQTFAYPTDKGHHIAEYTVLEPGGMRYVFGLPAYNKKQVDATFALDAVDGDDMANNHKLVNYVTGSMGADRIRNFEGRDHFFSSTEMPEYSHSHLLTLITSPDYVDITNDGPTEDDYGYYTKFNYYKAHSNYKWRSPYNQDTANYYKGFYSSALDNKGSYTYGEKEVWYVHSIETKTHVAIFVFEDRKDALGVNGTRGGKSTSQKLKCLKEIRLYAKKQIVDGVLPAKPIKTVVFEYTYELCDGIPNFNTSAFEDADIAHGKLTLKSVHFLYNGNKRGELNPYKFEYGLNPDYDPMQSDRWGNYRNDTGTEMGDNQENPYVNQDESDGARELRNEVAGAWSISKITTPSNAVIEIDYEQDDYQYVQDKLATQMFQIIGTGKSGETHLLSCNYVNNTLGLTGDEHIPITADCKRIFFKPEISQSELSAMSTGQLNVYIKSHVAALTDNWLYFKTWQRLQRPKNRTYWAEDYVTGYAKVKYPVTAGVDYGYVTESGKILPFFTVEETDNNKIKNPLQLAGLQYLRYSRGDLNMPQDNALGPEGALTMITSGLTMIMQMLELMSGYYSYAKMNNYCKFIENDKPSFVRLVSPDGRKYGGGHRVKSIQVHDGWKEASLSQEEYTYKQDYYYTDKNGRSSGVAAYEPALGGDEIALKYPYYFSPDSKFNNDPAFLTEAPFNESYFPAPVVGYSRMIIRSDINFNDQVLLDRTDQPDIKATGDAIREYEFYTAKDYPVITENTPADNVKNVIPVPIPLIGGIQISNYGYSQGYMIELNDMHGKSKTETTYAASAWDYDNKKLRTDAPFVSSKTYKYNTVGGYSPNKANRINSTLQVMDSEGQTRFAVVGESADVFSNLREDNSVSVSAGLQLNGGIDVVPYMGFISALPAIEYAQNTARLSVTNKVIYKTGMITEVVERMEGAVKTTENLLFDAENGQPLLTAVTTDYDDHNNTEIDAPIFTYSMPAHWYYTGMKAAYKNYRTHININMLMGTYPWFPMLTAYKYMEPGDEINYYHDGDWVAKYWVDEVNQEDGFKLVDEDGNVVIGLLEGTLEIVRSGHRNLQNMTSGTIVSLNNPLGENLPLLKFYNSNIYNNSVYEGIDLDNPVNVGGNPPGLEGFEGIEVQNPCTSNVHYEWTVSPHIVTNGSFVDGFHFGSFDVYEDDDAYPCRISFFIEDIGEGMIPYTGFQFNRIRLFYSGSGDGFALYTLPSGQTIRVKIVSYTEAVPAEGEGLCPLLVCIDGILDAKAVEYQSDWSYSGDFPVTAGNLWMTTGKGIWRVLRTNTYFTARKQAGMENDYKSYIGTDGTYERFIPFNFVAGNSANSQMENGWRWAAEVPSTGYGRGGYELENKNALGIYSSELFGFRYSSVIAVAANARYNEIGFESFERPGQNTSYSGPLEYNEFLNYGEANHIILSDITSSDFILSNEKAHTGLLSLKLDPHDPPVGVLSIKAKVVGSENDFISNYNGLQLVAGKKYIMSYWWYDGLHGVQQACFAGVAVNNTMSAISQSNLDESIDGWRKATVEFVAPSSPSAAFNIVIFMLGFDTYIDDIRIHPQGASFKSYVYDPVKFNLKAELDDNNYATFYNYNLEGNLTQVKKETREGIRTIRTTLKHVKPQ